MKKLDSRTLIELILLVVAVIFWALRKANVLYIPGLAAIALAIAMGLLGMGYIAQKQKSRKAAGVLLLALRCCRSSWASWRSAVSPPENA